MQSNLKTASTRVRRNKTLRAVRECQGREDLGIWQIPCEVPLDLIVEYLLATKRMTDDEHMDAMVDAECEAVGNAQKERHLKKQFYARKIGPDFLGWLALKKKPHELASALTDNAPTVSLGVEPVEIKRSNGARAVSVAEKFTSPASVVRSVKMPVALLEARHQIELVEKRIMEIAGQLRPLRAEGRRLWNASRDDNYSLPPALHEKIQILEAELAETKGRLPELRRTEIVIRQTEYGPAIAMAMREHLAELMQQVLASVGNCMAGLEQIAEGTDAWKLRSGDHVWDNRISFARAFEEEVGRHFREIQYRMFVPDLTE